VTRHKVLVVDDSPSILRVVENVLASAGYDVSTTLDGTQALPLAQRFAPDLILLDFMMPRMNGFQVCKVLREDATLRDIPVVLMCTKGDGAAERFVQQMGVVDYITKPFSPEAILALTSYTLDKHARGQVTSSEVPLREPTQPDDLPEDKTSLQLPSVVDDTPPSTRMPPPLPSLPPTGTGETGRVLLHRALTQKLQERLTGVTPEALSAAVEEALGQLPPLVGNSWAEGGWPALWGDMNLVPIPEVFQLMTLQGQTGLFQVWTDASMAATPERDSNQTAAGPTRFDVYFSNGRVDFVHASNLQEDFLLGRFLVSQGSIDKSELDALLRARKGRGKLLGQQLVALGHITRDQLISALRVQSSELVYELLRLQRGSFCMRKGALAQGEMGEARLGIHVDELLLEGLRRVDEWGLIEKEITSFDTRLEPDRRDGAEHLKDEEKYILSLVSPEWTVRQIVQRSGSRPFDVCKILYRLLVSRQVRRIA